MDAELERICAQDYLGELGERSLDDLRGMRTECQAVETSLSYLRRLVQGRLDVVDAEIARRGAGGDRDDVSTLIGKLPQILSDRTRTPGVGRLPQLLAPGDVSGSLADELAAIVTDGSLDSLPEASDDVLEATRDRLGALERRVSDQRRQVFGRIDALQAELIRRYRTGEANVESLLH